MPHTPRHRPEIGVAPLSTGLPQGPGAKFAIEPPPDPLQSLGRESGPEIEQIARLTAGDRRKIRADHQQYVARRAHFAPAGRPVRESASAARRCPPCGSSLPGQTPRGRITNPARHQLQQRIPGTPVPAAEFGKQHEEQIVNGRDQRARRGGPLDVG